MTTWLMENSLWLVGLGLMLASSGIDGAYMARWMTDLPGIGGAAVLGYVLNTTSDVAGMVLMYWYGRFRMDRSSRKRSMARFLLGTEAVAVLYSWLFSWRQLRIVLVSVEADALWVAPVAAGFIPLLLAFVGYAQALLSGRIESEPSDTPRRMSELESALVPHVAAQQASNSGHQPHTCPYCGRTDFASPQAVSAHLRWCTSHPQKESV